MTQQEKALLGFCCCQKSPFISVSFKKLIISLSSAFTTQVVFFFLCVERDPSTATFGYTSLSLHSFPCEDTASIIAFNYPCLFSRIS